MREKVCTSVSQAFWMCCITSFIETTVLYGCFELSTTITPCGNAAEISPHNNYLLCLQHTGEWPDSGGGWDQSGGRHTTVCCNCPEEHQRHSEVSSKPSFHLCEIGNTHIVACKLFRMKRPHMIGTGLNGVSSFAFPSSKLDKFIWGTNTLFSKITGSWLDGRSQERKVR